MEHILESELALPLPIDEVFPFFAEPENLERITPNSMRFNIITPPPITMKRGALIDYKLSLFGIPFKWKTEITRYEPPYVFVDEQLKGPYKLWVHTHTFEPTDRGTLIKDHVRYQLPLSPLGDIVHPIVRRQLNQIFSFRRRAVTEALMGG
ncbi:MAG: SRPBCC family protein [Anaerolineales bacterium]|nr:SRPBCC family protein [Anaerolineales bacterium]MCB9126914.1 SRPBCC family protein [Ardenticatenales bacterium]MCB9171458.1 SRPBCC family protein [Ardenticatenales bacterium]